MINPYYHYSAKLDVSCWGTAQRIATGDWCLAEATVYGKDEDDCRRKLKLGGWCINNTTVLCPECSGCEVVTTIADSLNSNGVT